MNKNEMLEIIEELKEILKEIITVAGTKTQYQ